MLVGNAIFGIKDSSSQNVVFFKWVKVPPCFNSHLWWIVCGVVILVLAGNNMESQPKVGVWSRWCSSPTAAWWTLLVSARLVHCLRLGSQGHHRSCSECTGFCPFCLQCDSTCLKTVCCSKEMVLFAVRGFLRLGACWESCCDSYLP